jgi:hypothetical protein
MTRCRSILLVTVAMGALGAAGLLSAPALAVSERPGWELYANTLPTNLVHGVSDVQEISLHATGGTFTLSIEVNGAVQETIPISYPASPQTVEQALEALPGIGGVGGHVTVTGGPEDYVVSYSGALGNIRAAPLSANGSALTGAEPSATTSVKTEGAASGSIRVEVFNVGAGASFFVGNEPITVTDRLPAGVRAKEAGAPNRAGERFGVAPTLVAGIWDCTGNGASPAPSVAGASVVTCTSDPVGLPAFAGGGGLPTFDLTEAPNLQPAVAIVVEAVSAADEPEHTSCAGEASFCNRVSISGGQALEAASTEDPVTISSKPAKGGLASADAWFSNADGTIDRQAGSHPYTATFAFTSATAIGPEKEGVIAGGEVRNLETEVPAGLVGDLHDVPQCRVAELIKEACPPSSMVGIFEVSTLQLGTYGRQVFNMVPPPGTPAELGFVLEATPVFLSFSVKSGSDYRLIAHADAIPAREVYQTIVTLWGSPQEASHDRWRGRPADGGCSPEQLERIEGNENSVDYCTRAQNPVVQSFLTLPTSCGEAQPLAFRELSAWQEPDAKSEVAFLSHDANGEPAGYTGCEALQFEPSITIAPETARADTPTGLTAEVKAPLGGLEAPNALAPATLRNTKVTLPEGLTINPGQAAGLRACPPGRPAPGVEGDALTTPEEAARGEEDDEAPSCSDAAKVGTATIKTPLLESARETQLNGNVYILQSNPPEVKILVAASADGVNVKFVGVVHLNEQTGQVTTEFDNTPQLPFSDFTLSFDGGAKAALVTPAQCGAYTANVDFQSWANPFIPDALGSPAFTLNSGPAGAPCPSGPLPFAPSMTAGTSTNQAGGFASFSTLLQRGDGTQRLESFRFTSPAGLAGLISTVPLCPEPQAAAGTCASSSHIGHAIVSSGPGANPLTIPQPGEPEAAIYLTGPYKGAPFGLSILTPVIAGPFNLGTIVTRAKIEVDPTTARVTVTTDPLPQIVKGVPTDLRSVYAVIDRPGFFFNPTNCESQQFTGSATSAGGAATAPISSSFGIDGCRGLTFAPKFSASTQGNGLFNRNGASLNVKISTKQGPQSNPAVQAEANIKKVDVQLPIQLPSRLTTLQKACTEKQFATNPAGCPEASNVGTAVVHTPVLPGALTGPAYLVSHGSAAFPDLDLILQGDGVTILLTGTTDIKKGITFSRFDTTPDAPISSFELNLPERKFSALAANGNLCKPTTTKTVKKRVAVRRHGRTVHVTKSVKQQVAAPLSMPTTITAQNGAVVTQTTKIAVTGCAKAKAKAKKKVKKAKRKAGKRKG